MEFLTISPIAILAICIMIGTIIVAYFKKWMMTYALIFANLIVFFLTVFFHKELLGGIVNDIEYVGLGFRPIYLQLQYTKGCRRIH